MCRTVVGQGISAVGRFGFDILSTCWILVLTWVGRSAMLHSIVCKMQARLKGVDIIATGTFLSGDYDGLVAALTEGNCDLSKLYTGGNN